MATCVVLFLLGLPLTTNSGMYVLQLMDSYGVSYPLLTLGLIEIVILSWRYGAEQLHANAEVTRNRHEVCMMEKCRKCSTSKSPVLGYTCGDT